MGVGPSVMSFKLPRSRTQNQSFGFLLSRMNSLVCRLPREIPSMTRITQLHIITVHYIVLYIVSHHVSSCVMYTHYQLISTIQSAVSNFDVYSEGLPFLILHLPVAKWQVFRS